MALLQPAVASETLLIAVQDDPHLLLLADAHLKRKAKPLEDLIFQYECMMYITIYYYIYYYIVYSWLVD